MEGTFDPTEAYAANTTTVAILYKSKEMRVQEDTDSLSRSCDIWERSGNGC